MSFLALIPLHDLVCAVDVPHDLPTTTVLTQQMDSKRLCYEISNDAMDPRLGYIMFHHKRLAAWEGQGAL